MPGLGGKCKPLQASREPQDQGPEAMASSACIRKGQKRVSALVPSDYPRRSFPSSSDRPIQPWCFQDESGAVADERECWRSMSCNACADMAQVEGERALGNPTASIQLGQPAQSIVGVLSSVP